MSARRLRTLAEEAAIASVRWMFRKQQLEREKRVLEMLSTINDEEVLDVLEFFNGADDGHRYLRALEEKSVVARVNNKAIDGTMFPSD